MYAANILQRHLEHVEQSIRDGHTIVVGKRREKAKRGTMRVANVDDDYLVREANCFGRIQDGPRVSAVTGGIDNYCGVFP